MDISLVRKKEFGKCVLLGSSVIMALTIISILSSNPLLYAQSQTGNNIGESQPSNGQQEKISQQGVITSSVDPLPGHEEHQSATVLRLRSDGGIYSGVVTFTASNEVEVQVFHNLGDNSTIQPIAPEFGALNIVPLPNNIGSVVISTIRPDFGEVPPFTASVPFSGSSLSFHNIEGEPFAVSYSVDAEVSPSNKINDINQPPVIEEEEEEEEEEG